jgi:hypothetical protein
MDMETVKQELGICFDGKERMKEGKRSYHRTNKGWESSTEGSRRDKFKNKIKKEME